MSSRLFARVGWGLADQAVSSLTNFAVGFLIARTVAPRDFGAFGIAFATYHVALGISRSLCLEPLSVRYSGVGESTWATGSRAALGGVLVIGLAAGGICIVAAIGLEGALQKALLLLGLLLPGLLLQDGWRFAFFAARRGRSAFINDAVWALGMVPATALALVLGRGSLAWLMLAWGGGAAAAAAWGIVQARLAPTPSQAILWWRSQRDLAPRFLVEFGALTGVAQLSLYGVGAVAGLGAVGTLRGAQLLQGPLQVVLFGMFLVSVPEGVRMARGFPPRLWPTSISLSAGLSATAVSWVALLLVMPRSVGAGLLGATWDEARSVILPVSLSMLALAAITGAATGLRALGTARRSLLVRLIVAPLSLAGYIGGAAIAGASGAAWGGAALSLAAVPLWWWHFSRALREQGPRPVTTLGESIPLPVADVAD